HDRGIEVEAPHRQVLTGALQPVSNENARRVTVDEAFSDMRYRGRQAQISRVAAAKAIDRVSTAHERALRPGVILKLPECIGPDKAVTLSVVNWSRLRKGGAPNLFPQFPRSCVKVGAAVGDEVEPVQEELEAEDVVVPVPAPPLEPHLAAVDDQMGRGPT